MATNPVSTNNMWPNYAKGNVSSKSGNGQELGKDQFLSILITQLRHQDPLQPMQDREFIAQMAQFTSLEQLMNINTQLTAMSQSLGAASSLIGKQISWMFKPEDGSDSVMKSGIVDSIIVREGVHYAKVGDSEVSLDQIVKIENAVTENDPEALISGPAVPDTSSPGPTEPEITNPDPSVPETGNPDPSAPEAVDPGQGGEEPGGVAP
ncbi:flagellar hook capping protein [Paenibacillus sp. LC231]|uniref:flagellar hook capping FlgD N-terminal domain-containing protein n=1 Tax=unclassified Paenibacillus TaxID=185978 RepID=UPI0008DDBBC8|nr:MULTISPECIES: flagellar hook capping FlgD N-terminal domain-containing protein [unclassified Paenibacillus]MCT1398609.1 flagellar hook capping protein [Paenibacillus sp. p3-SID867]OIB02632.1 flagellar hook capping protein [Paenibacillus sp. LC231]